jgi:hypothetical protein
VRPVPARLVEEAAREFQLEEVASSDSGKLLTQVQQSGVLALLQNLDVLLGRFLQSNGASSASHERKP